MTTATCQEVAQLRAQLDAAERELDHRANVISSLADTLATTRTELDEAVRLGTEYATALAASVPHSPALLFSPLGGAARSVGYCTCPCGKGTDPGCPIHP